MTDRRRKILKAAGFVLIAAALCAIGYAAYNLISSELGVQESLEEAEALIEAGQMADEMNAYSGDPEDLLLPGEEATPGPDGQLPEEVLQAPDATPGAGGELTGETAQAEAENGGSGGNAAGRPAATGPKATAKPKSGAYGILIFDSLGGRKVPVLNGTTTSELNRGAAHHPRSSPPGATGNCVIFGHRNTVFRGFGKLKVGDTIQLQVPGKTYKYRVDSMAVVDPDDKRIFKAYGEAVMTLVTCYPFNYVGAAPRRYIVVAVLQ